MDSAAATPSQPRQRKRSDAAKNVVLAGIALNTGQRGLSLVRLGFATPHAWRNRKMGQWAFQVALQKSTVGVVPHTGGKWGLWGKAFATSQALKGAGALFGLAMAGPNLVDGVRTGGADGLAGTRSGRTGVVSSISGVASLGFMAEAAARAHEKGPLAMGKRMFTDPRLGTWRVVGVGMAAYGIVLANETGLLDGLNTGDTRSWPQVWRDSGRNAWSWVREHTPID